MQLSIFTDQDEKQIVQYIEHAHLEEPKYFYTIRTEFKKLNPKSLEWKNTTEIKTIHCVYTSLEKVRDMIEFLKSLHSYCGWYHITRHETMPNLNYSTLTPL